MSKTTFIAFSFPCTTAYFLHRLFLLPHPSLLLTHLKIDGDSSSFFPSANSTLAEKLYCFHKRSWEHYFQACPTHLLYMCRTQKVGDKVTLKAPQPLLSFPRWLWKQYRATLKHWGLQLSSARETYILFSNLFLKASNNNNSITSWEVICSTA